MSFQFELFSHFYNYYPIVANEGEEMWEDVIKDRALAEQLQLNLTSHCDTISFSHCFLNNNIIFLIIS